MAAAPARGGGGRGGRAPKKKFNMKNRSSTASRYNIPLLDAVHSKNVDQMRSILSREGADPNVADPETGTTALMLASVHASEEMVTALLLAGADPEATNAMGKTAEMVWPETKNIYNRLLESGMLERTGLSDAFTDIC